MRIPSGVTDQYVYFVAVDATDFTTCETGLSSFTVYRSRNGGASAAMTTPTVNETSAANMPGVYELLLDEDMTIDGGDDEQEMVFHIAHAGMAPVTRAISLFRPKITAGSTSVAQTGDSFARLGAPTGASVSADVAAIEAQTDDIGVAGAGLTAIPWNAAWDAEVQSEAADALTAYDPPTKAELDAGLAALNDLSAAQVNAEVDAAFTTPMADSVAADGSIPTREQALLMVSRFLFERSVTSTTVTVTKEDGSTSSMIFALDDATNPTSITRAS